MPSKKKKKIKIKEDPDPKYFIMDNKYCKLLDHNRLIKNAKNISNVVNVTLKKSELKGIGLYTTKSFKEGDDIAYYKINTMIEKGYDSPTNFVYSFEVYKKNGDPYKKYIGDIDLKSFPDPINGMTFWAPFANEPSIGQQINAELDQNLKEIYKKKKKTKPGQSIVYKLVATKSIKKGEEILWYYGEDYDRDYEVDC
jgi:hypothetical protein